MPAANSKVFFVVQYSPYMSSVDGATDIEDQVEKYSDYRPLLEVLFKDDRLEGPHFEEKPADWPQHLKKEYDHPGSFTGMRYIFYGTLVIQGVRGAGAQGVSQFLQDLFYIKPDTVVKPNEADLIAILEAKGVSSEKSAQLACVELEALYIEGPFQWIAWYLESEDGEPKLYFLDLGSGGGDH